jgi:DnaK suppressor protein
MGEAPHLTADQREEIRKDLLRALARLERSMQRADHSAENVALDQTTVGRLSRIDALQNESLNRNLKDRERDELGRVLGALRRLEEDRYGVCEACGEPIAFERLLIYPEAATCAACGVPS